MSTTNDYNKMTRIELIPLGIERGIKYICKMNKSELIKNLKKNDDDTNYIIDIDVRAKCQEYHKKWKTQHREQYNKYYREYRVKNKNQL